MSIKVAVYANKVINSCCFYLFGVSLQCLKERKRFLDNVNRYNRTLK